MAFAVKHITAAIFLISSLTSASADSLEDGIAAYESDDYAIALVLLRPLANKGSASAQYQLGVMYENGRGVPQDFSEAAKWLLLAANQGQASAQYDIGVLYEYGRGLPTDQIEAVKWFRLAATQGLADAQYRLGYMYLNGQGVLRDATEAMKWFRLAADQGRADAQLGLGYMYYNGIGVLQSYTEAVRWYRLAADQGRADAQSNLGLMYASGAGVEQDNVQAYKWFSLAATQGNKDAEKNRDSITKRMPPNQVAEAEKLARDWKSARRPPTPTAPVNWRPWGIIGKDDRITVPEGHPWDSIGQVNVSGVTMTELCTGTLIAPNLVLTAAHCVMNPLQGRPFHPEDIHFVSGLRGSAHKGHSIAKCLHVLESYTYAGPVPEKKPESAYFYDAAVIVLKEGITVVPVPLAEGLIPELGLHFVHAAYGGDWRFMLSAHFNCQLVKTDHHLWFTNCDTFPGSSGGPLFVRTEDGLKLAAIMAATSKYNWAVPISDWITLAHNSQCP